ncbi:MAG: hypothetical protein DRN12_06535, partial [Thermoplasmata archaeon]
DWMGYCNGRLDGMTLINVPSGKVKQWPSRNVTIIKGDDPYSVASQIALNDWSYSDKAVIAVIETRYKNLNNITEGKIEGFLPKSEIEHKQFQMEQPDIGTGGTYKSFDIKDSKYRYVIATLTWSNKKDLDLQLYDTHLGMVDASMTDVYEQSQVGLREVIGSFIHNLGEWRVSITAVPKKSWDLGDYSDLKILSNSKKANVEIKLLPGVMIKLPKTPFGCRDVKFKLKWSNSNIRLAFTLIDPAGTEIASSIPREKFLSGDIVYRKPGETDLNVTQLGECRENENYSICVFSLDNISSPIDFSLEYSWHQNFSKIEGEEMSSASNGAVLASKLNAPLLYVNSSSLPSCTEKTLYKLGVKQIYLIDIGSHLKKNVKERLSNIAKIIEYSTTKDIYNSIRKDVNDNSIVFTTIDPWTYWYVAELKPAGEYPGALFIGPAAYIAAHHGTPVVIVDIHPRLSQAIVYPTNFWTPASHGVEPSSGSMMLFGRQVYDFLEDYNLGKLEPDGPEAQDKETIITVAGQYDIGIPWDRAFTGAALPGRFTFSPVDTSYWISRNIFYPALIFENPAMQGENEYINGSVSKVSHLPGSRFRDPLGVNLVITKPSEEERFRYPILHTYNTYLYRFNELASKQWDFKYTRADGIIPYETDSLDPIDDGAAHGKSGAYYPDMSETEVIPFYARKAGYGNVFSTNFEEVVEDLNRGVIIWVEECHGHYIEGGVLGMWDPDSPYVLEKNPWRAYEVPLLYLGNWRELIRTIVYISQGQPSRFIEGLIRFHLLTRIGSTENPDVATLNPQLSLLNRFLSRIGFPIDMWGATGIMIHRDRILHPLKTFREGLPFINFYNGDGKVTISVQSGNNCMKSIYGYDFDNALKNLHSCGINTISCLPAGTFLHLTWMRHGMSYQIIDPWTTTDWAAVWNQMIIKLFAEGYTVGQAYERGIRACGPEYIVNHWWWDKWENVELFGDPNLRVFVPDTKYTDYQNGYEENHWTQEETQPLRYDSSFSIDGHNPFGVTSYPHERSKPLISKFYILVILLVILIILISILFLFKEKNISEE